MGYKVVQLSSKVHCKHDATYQILMARVSQMIYLLSYYTG
jgi:hypothetical protein